MADTASAPQEAIPITIRQAGANDYNYIYDTWKRSYHWSWWSQYHRYMPTSWSRDSSDARKIYGRGMAATIDGLREQPDAVFVVATAPDDPKFLLGWACMDSRCVHYVYVRDTMRRAGIASRLIGDRYLVVCSHWTPDCVEIAKTKPGYLRYEP